MIRKIAPLFAAALLAFTAAAALAQGAKKAITHEDVWLMKRVGAPVVSPDGRWIVFSLVEPAYEEKDQVSDLWLVSSDGSSGPRRLTSTKAGESGAAWSSDSKRIAFSARREGDEIAQIYIIDVAGGGEAVLPEISGWPNGRRSRWSKQKGIFEFFAHVHL